MRVVCSSISLFLHLGERKTKALGRERKKRYYLLIHETSTLLDYPSCVIISIVIIIDGDPLFTCLCLAAHLISLNGSITLNII